MGVVKDKGSCRTLGAGVDTVNGQREETGGMEAIGTPGVFPLTRERRIRVAVGAKHHALNK